MMKNEPSTPPVTPAKDATDPTALTSTSMTFNPTTNPQQHLVKTRFWLLAHPLSVRDWNDCITYPILGVAEALKYVNLMPARSDSISGAIAKAFQTMEEYKKNETYLGVRYPGVAAVAASSIMTERHMELARDYPETHRDCLKDGIPLLAQHCGTLLLLSVFYSTTLCIDREYVRENLEDYLKVLNDELFGVSLLLFQQIACDKIINSPGFRTLCEVIDEEKIFAEYLYLRRNREELLESSAAFRKAEVSFQSLSEDEVRFIADEAKANAPNFDRGKSYTPCGPWESGYGNDSDMQNIMTMASALALLEGAPQIEAAEQLLKSDRLFGLTTFSLLTSPWYQDEVRATALHRMVQEDPIVGREMAKIALIRDERPAILAAAREILA